MNNALTAAAICILTAVACLFTRATSQRAFTTQLKEIAMTATQDIVDAVVAQLGKAKGEIIAKLTDLQGQLDAAGVSEQVDLSPLVQIAQSLDDIVPDAPAEEPADEPVDPVADDEPADPVVDEPVDE